MQHINKFWIVLQNNFMFRTLLLFPINIGTKQKLMDVDKRIYSICPDVVNRASQMGKAGHYLWLCRETNYWAYWLAALKPEGFPS